MLGGVERTQAEAPSESLERSQGSGARPELLCQAPRASLCRCQGTAGLGASDVARGRGPDTKEAEPGPERAPEHRTSPGRNSPGIETLESPPTAQQLASFY